MISLNERQLEAVNFMDGCCSSMRYLAAEDHGSRLPDHNLVKNTACLQRDSWPDFYPECAQAMKDRLAAVLAERAAKVTLLTIHGFAFTSSSGRPGFRSSYGKDRVLFMTKLLKR